MADRFKDALAKSKAKSKAFVNNFKMSQGRLKAKDNDNSDDDDDTDDPANTNSYRRRMRVIAESERRENPINLGENGWGAQSWGRVKQEQKQKGELESLYRDFSIKDKNKSPSSPPERQQWKVSGPRGFSDTYEKRGTEGTPKEAEKSSGSPEHYYSPLPFRTRGQGDLPSPSPSVRLNRAHRATPAGTSPTRNGQRERVSGPHLTRESTVYIEARATSFPGPSSPTHSALRARIPGPKPNILRSRGTYNRRGERMSPATANKEKEKDTEQYLARKGFIMSTTKAPPESPRSPGTAGTKGSRTADGMLKGIGPTLW